MKELIGEYGLSIITVIVVVALIAIYTLFGGITADNSQELGIQLGDIDVKSIVEELNER